MKFKHLTLLIGGSLLLAGCSGELLPNTEETAQMTPVTRTATLTAARPSIPAQTPTVTPDMAGTIVAVSPFHVLESRPSPDGLWRVEIVAYECATVEGWNEKGGAMVEWLKLVQTDDSSETLVDSRLISCGDGVGAYGLGGWFWSFDSRYFYYTDTREGVPDGGGGCWDPSLIQLDAASGTVEHLSQMWKLSPDGKTIAMWQGGNDLSLLSLADGEAEHTPIVWNPGEEENENERTPDAEVCEIAWSPDGHDLAYLQSPCPFCFSTDDAKYSILHVNLDGMEQSVLTSLDGYHSVEMQWKTASQIELWASKEGGQKKFVLNPVTGVLVPAP